MDEHEQHGEDQVEDLTPNDEDAEDVKGSGTSGPLTGWRPPIKPAPSTPPRVK